MATLFGLADLEAKTRALAAESDVYRETLRLETRNLALHYAHVRQRYSTLLMLRKFAWLAIPLFGWKARRRRGRRFGWMAFVLGAWRVYRTYGPLLKSFLPRVFRDEGDVLHRQPTTQSVK